MADNKIEKISSVTQKLQPDKALKAPNKDYFESLMSQRRVENDHPANTTAQQIEQAKKTEKSLFEEVKELNKTPGFTTKLNTPGELATQTEDVVAQIGELKNKLETPNLQIKSSVQTLLRSKLNHVDENLKVALDKAGLDYVPPEKPTSLQKPIERFLGLLSHSQNQLDALGQDIRSFTSEGSHLTPANMLLLQMKVGYIQGEIEMFSAMLNQALSSTKTIMNVQV